MDVRLWRDVSDRLTCDWPGVDATSYPAACHAVAEAFSLTPSAELVVGLEQMFWDFRRNDQVVGLDWDIWMGFMSVAQSPAAEPLVEEIAMWLRSR